MRSRLQTSEAGLMKRQLAELAELACLYFCAPPHLEEVFDFRVVIGLLLDQRGSVQLARTESADRRRKM